MDGGEKTHGAKDDPSPHRLHNMRTSLPITMALLALRLHGACGFNGPVAHRYSPSSSLRVASTAWATSNDGVAENYAANEQRGGSSKTKAPLVDSTLLRFLSSEKRSGAVIEKEPTGSSSSTACVVPLEATSAANGGVKTSPQIPAEGLSYSTTDGTQLPTALSSNKPIGGSWLSQYNAQRVALKLQALGVGNEASLKAGKVIQDYVLARISRRRIRKFLQERDVLWESGYSVSRLGRKGMGERVTPAAATSFDIDSVIAVMLEYGLTGNDVAAVFSHSPSVVMMKARKSKYVTRIENPDRNRPSTLEETLDRAFVRLLGETLKLRRYDARKVLRASPGLLTSKGSVSAIQVVDLMVSLGSSTNSIARDKSSLPTLLCRSPALIFRLVAFLSSARLKVPLGAIGPILRQKQSAGLLDAVAPVKRTFTLDIYGDIASKNLTSLSPESEILGYLKADDTLRQKKIERSYRTMEALAGILRRSAGIRDFRKILSSHPDSFFVNITNVHCVTQYLREEVGMSRDDIAKAIQTLPILLEQDLSKVKRVVEYLETIEVEEDALPSIFRSFPATLLLDIDKEMVPVVTFLRGIGVRNIGRFVTRLPPVLGYSVEDDLKPKWSFLEEVCQFDYFEVVRFPAYFSYPLERVIRMRYEYLRDCKGIPIQLARVDDVLRFGDRDFATEIALDEDGGDAFAKFVSERSFAMQTTSMRRRRKRRKM
ncbi:hypothetical protein ACHAWF_005527 [Thalassiosira exigua]